MPAPAAHGVYYPRFAELTAQQKGQARALWRDSSKLSPLLDCYFVVRTTGEVDWVFWSNPNVAVCIYPPTVWSSNWPDGDPRHGKVTREVPYDCYLHAVECRKVGDRLTAYAGAPGTGHVTHVITRIDEKGVWGIEVENTMRELSPSETY